MIYIINKVIQTGEPTAPLTTELVPRGDGEDLGQRQGDRVATRENPLLSVAISWVFRGSYQEAGNRAYERALWRATWEGFISSGIS